MRQWGAVGSLLAVLGLSALGCGDDKPKTNNPPPSELHKLVVLTSTASNGGWDGLAVNGKYLYLASAEARGIHIFEVRNGSDATEVAAFDADGASGLIVRGDRLFYSDVAGVHVADISSPTSIKPLSLLKDPDFGIFALRNIRSSPKQVVVPSVGVGPKNEVTLFDMLHPEKPEQVARFAVGGDVTSMAIDGSTLYVAEDVPPGGNVEVWDVSNWDAPKRLSTSQGRCGLIFAAGGGVVLCGQGGSAGISAMAQPVLDARDPVNPAFPLVPADLWFGATIFERVGSYVFVQTALRDINSPYKKFFVAYDIRDPLHPRSTGIAAGDLTDLGGADDATQELTSDDRFLYARHPKGVTIYGRQGASDE